MYHNIPTRVTKGLSRVKSDFGTHLVHNVKREGIVICILRRDLVDSGICGPPFSHCTGLEHLNSMRRECPFRA